MTVARVALVTGAGRGIGRAIALELGRRGHDVAVNFRSSEAAARSLAEEIAGFGRRATAIQADVSRPEDVERLFKESQAALGPVDVLVNNAGITHDGLILRMSDADWDAVIDTNLKGVFLCARAFGPGMCERGWGRVINISSMLGTIALPGRSPYASSKAAVLGLTRVLALEWAAAGVTVNAICPGPFGTEMNRQLLNDPEKYQAFVQKLPVGRWGELHEIKGIALFLASDASSFMTGTALALDGGWTAQ